MSPLLKAAVFLEYAPFRGGYAYHPPATGGGDIPQGLSGNGSFRASERKRGTRAVAGPGLQGLCAGACGPQKTVQSERAWLYGAALKWWLAPFGLNQALHHSRNRALAVEMAVDEACEVRSRTPKSTGA